MKALWGWLTVRNVDQKAAEHEQTIMTQAEDINKIVREFQESSMKVKANGRRR